MCGIVRVRVDKQSQHFQIKIISLSKSAASQPKNASLHYYLILTRICYFLCALFTFQVYICMIVLVAKWCVSVCVCVRGVNQLNLFRKFQKMKLCVIPYAGCVLVCAPLLLYGCRFFQQCNWQHEYVVTLNATQTHTTETDWFKSDKREAACFPTQFCCFLFKLPVGTLNNLHTQ